MSSPPRAPSSSECVLPAALFQVSRRGGCKSTRGDFNHTLAQQTPPQLISVPPWMQAPASPVEERHAREDPWSSSWGSSPELCPEHPMSLNAQPGGFGFKFQTPRGLASQRPPSQLQGAPKALRPAGGSGGLETRDIYDLLRIKHCNVF